MKRRTFIGRLGQSLLGAFGAVAAVFSGCKKPVEKGTVGGPGEGETPPEEVEGPAAGEAGPPEAGEEPPSEQPGSEPGNEGQAPPTSGDRAASSTGGDELEDDFGGGGQIDGGSHGRGVAC